MSFDLDTILPRTVQYPIYYSSNPSIIANVSDKIMTLFCPIVAYWALSFFFHLLDLDIFRWPSKYRIHESAEVVSRNLASRTDVIGAVVLQQAMQTLLGILWLEDGESVVLRNHTEEMRPVGLWLGRLVFLVLSHEQGKSFLAAWGSQLVSWLYWWGIPIVQFLFGIFIIDTWQYFWHRALHINKTLYKRFHAVHHRLYVPYAYGALYNHPVEGFVLDSLGAALAEALTGMTIRQAALLFVLSTLKTVDDHCGYALPWDPLQMLFGNNADYHDIHHQTVGIKSNFSQPYFIHWDALLGTRMTRAEMNVLKVKRKDE